jgi:phosphotransferase system HPr-like phosphotransfer protein
MSDEIKDSCTHGEESWYCVICRDDYVEGLQAQVAQLQTTISQLHKNLEVEKSCAQKAEAKDFNQMMQIANQETAISTLTRERDEAIAALGEMSKTCFPHNHAANLPQEKL